MQLRRDALEPAEPRNQPHRREGGLIFILVPVVASWLKISWLDALVVDVGLFAFFFCYAFVFQWAFDRMFDVPAATKQP